jgi:hypothetical protein
MGKAGRAAVSAARAFCWFLFVKGVKGAFLIGNGEEI